MTEEDPTAEALAALNQEAREKLVRVEAMAALIESGCMEPSHFVSMMVNGLRVVHVGEGDFNVYAVDRNGEIRQGTRGPMTPLDLANELRQDPGFHEIGWRPRTHPTASTKTGREMRGWQLHEPPPRVGTSTRTRRSSG